MSSSTLLSDISAWEERLSLLTGISASSPLRSRADSGGSAAASLRGDLVRRSILVSRCASRSSTLFPIRVTMGWISFSSGGATADSSLPPRFRLVLALFEPEAFSVSSISFGMFNPIRGCPADVGDYSNAATSSRSLFISSSASSGSVGRPTRSRRLTSRYSSRACHAVFFASNPITSFALEPSARQ